MRALCFESSSDLPHMNKNLYRMTQHLFSNQKVIRDLETRLRKVARERDEALGQVKNVDSKLRAAKTKTLAAKQIEVNDAISIIIQHIMVTATHIFVASYLQYVHDKQDKNHHRHVDLEHQRAELDTFCGELKHREEAISNREKKTIGLLEQIENR